MTPSDIPWDYSVTTGSGRTPDEAAKGLFSDGATAVCVHQETFGRTVTYYYIVEGHEPQG